MSSSLRSFVILFFVNRWFRCGNPFDAVGSVNDLVLAGEEPCLDALSVVGDAGENDPDLAQKIGAATTLEVRATEIPYVFAPCIAVCRDPRWGRCYESYSEDPKIVEQMTEIIPGLQGSLPANAKKGFPYVATIVGTLVAFLIVPMRSLGSDNWKIIAALIGSYIGGCIESLIDLLGSKNASIQHNVAFALYGLVDNE
ncbi:hypothetical protein HN873_056051, partial [Arachis hypogaea]